MRRMFAIVLAVVSALPAVSPAFARNAGHIHRAARGNDPTVLLAPAPPAPAMENRIPAPLAPPARAPTVNGPVSQPAFRGLHGIGQ
jgi:hypothetical protein